MRDRQRKRSVKGSYMSSIASAVVPSAAFVAVPTVQPPGQTLGSERKGLPLVSALLNSSLLGRLLATPQAAADRTSDEDPESSSFDFDHMEEPGYSTVQFGVLSPTGEETGDLSETPARDDGNYDSLGPPAPLPIHIAGEQRRDADEDGISQLYAVVNKRRYPSDPICMAEEKPADRVMKPPNEEGLDSGGTPVKETVTKSMIYTNVAPPGETDSQAEDLRMTSIYNHYKSFLEAGQDSDPKPFVVRQADREKAATHSLTESIPNNRRPASGVTGDSNKYCEPTGSIPDNRRSASGVAGGSNKYGRLEEVLLENRKLLQQNQELTDCNQDLETEVEHLNKLVRTSEYAGPEKARELRLKEQIVALQNTVHRLNVELSKYQAKYKCSKADVKKNGIVGLPCKGPIPSWLIHVKFLSPLLFTYDERLEEQEQLIKQYAEDLRAAFSHTEKLVFENESLHKKLQQIKASGCVPAVENEQLQEQAKLVLEENQILIEQLELQRNKWKDLHSAHVKEVSKLTKRIVDSEAEKNDLEIEVSKWKKESIDLKNKVDVVMIENQNKVPLRVHTNMISELKQTLNEQEQQHKNDCETLFAKIQACQIEKQSAVEKQIELKGKSVQLKAKLKAHQFTLRATEQKNLLLQKALEAAEKGEHLAQQQLARVINLAENCVQEKESLAKLVKNREKEAKKAVGKQLKSSICQEKLKNELDQYKATLLTKVKEQNDEVSNLKFEYEIEIKRLRLLLREKETLLRDSEIEKLQTEENLEILWQAAKSENKQMKNLLMKKLHNPNFELEASDSDVDELYHSSDANGHEVK